MSDADETADGTTGSEDEPSEADAAEDPTESFSPAGQRHSLREMTDTEPEWDFKERDVLILRELARDPQLSARELTDVLEAEHGIDVSHVTVSKSIRNMRDANVFREAILPNEAYFSFSLFEFQFNPEHFEEGWRDAMEHIREDKSTLFYFLCDGAYQWRAVMMFPDGEAESKWIHEFYKEHGKVINNLRNHALTNVLKFGTDPELFENITDGQQ